MTTITVADVLKKIDNDLAWRGPGGHQLGHIVLPRAMAEYLRNTVIAIIRERDNLVYEKEHPTV